MKSNLKIRQLNGNDWNEFFQFRLLGLQEYPEAFGTSAKEWGKASQEKVQATLNDYLVLGAFDNELIGVIGFTREKRNNINHKGTIWGFFVKNDSQKKGVGKLLLGKLIDELKSHENLEYVRCIVTESSKNAISVFKSFGFINYGLEQKAIKVENQYFDDLYFKKELK